MAKCFVIMPFSTTETCTEAQWTEVYNELIVPAVRQTKLGFEVTRSQIRTGAFIKDILVELEQADIVVADLTDRNPNVFYELGVRHTLRNRTILISQDMKHVPSDLRSYGVIIYDRTPSGVSKFKADIKRVLKEIIKDESRPDNPVSDFLRNKDFSLFQFERVQTLRKLSAMVSEISYNLRAKSYMAETVMECLSPTSPKNTYSLYSFRTGALEELVSTNYVTLSPQELEEAHRLLDTLTIANSCLDFWRQGNTGDDTLQTCNQNITVADKKLRTLMVKVAKVRERILSSSKLDSELPSIVLADENHRTLIATTGLVGQAES